MGLFSAIFGGASDFASAAGDFAEAKAYGKAATFAGQNAVIAKEAGDIKLAQTGRQIFQVLGQQRAGYAGAGLAQSGSAIDVYRNSVSQGALQKALVEEQTQINVTGYKEQETAFQGMQAAANAAGAAGIAKGIGSILSGIFDPLGIFGGGSGTGFLTTGAPGPPGVGSGG